jgi:hypothetical protein
MTDTTAAATAQNDTGASGEQTSTTTDPSVNDTGTQAQGQQTNTQQQGAQGDQTQTQDQQTGDGQGDGDQQTGELQDFQMPEGMELDSELAGELKAFAQEKNLTQDEAQKIADLGVKMLQKQQSAFEDLKAGWVETAKTDKEIGGEAFEANLAKANEALAAFAEPDLIKFLQDTGLGNHPEMIRAWNRVGKAISEDRLVVGKATDDGSPKAPENVLFPEMK